MSKEKFTPSRDSLSEVIDYDPMSGEMRTRERRGKAMPGDAFIWTKGKATILGTTMTPRQVAWILSGKTTPIGPIKNIPGTYGFAIASLSDSGMRQKAADNLTQAILRSVLRYCWATGHFSWIAPSKAGMMPGDIAGSVNRNGYRQISIGGRLYQAHRLAILYLYGEMPIEVDHKNGKKDDNRLDNIRVCTRQQNSQNMHKSRGGRSGLLGVGWNKKAGMWRASISRNGTSFHIGYYDTPEEAHQAYLEKKRELHEFCMI